MSNLVELNIKNITREDLDQLLRTDDLRDMNGRKLKEFTEDPFYMSIKQFRKYASTDICSRVLTSLLNEAIEGCCIARLVNNNSYILLKLYGGNVKIVTEAELTEDQRSLYEGRIH